MRVLCEHEESKEMYVGTRRGCNLQAAPRYAELKGLFFHRVKFPSS